MANQEAKTVPRGRLPARRRLEDSATRFWVGNWELANAGEEGELLLYKGLIKGSHICAVESDRNGNHKSCVM